MSPQGSRPLRAFLAVVCFAGAVPPLAAQDGPTGATTAGSLPAPAQQPIAAPDSSNAAASERPEPPAPPDASAAPAAPDDDAGAPDEPVIEPASPAIGNDDLRVMIDANFSEQMILAVIAANETRFDVSPRALVALKSDGVSDNVIEAVLAAEMAKRQAEADALAATRETTATASAAKMPTDEFVRLSAMIERLAAQQEAAAARADASPPPPPSTDPSPHAWILGRADKTAVPPTIAQVAFTDARGMPTLKTLHGLADKALAFANPAVSGIATTLGSLFRPGNEDRTAVWALAGSTAARQLGAHVAFEVEFGTIPGVDPERYRPAIVRLVSTSDNYRLVAAAKTDGANKGVLPHGPIVEENVDTELTRIGRGRYRAAAKEALGAGEYALVLRPSQQKEPKHKKGDASLGELLGGGTSQILYVAWDFHVGP